MPEILELKPLKNKKLKLILIESEFPIDWWFDVPKTLKEDLFWNLRLISKEYIQLINSLIENYKPKIALEERPNFWNTTNNSEDPLKKLFQIRNISFDYADISENAELYLSSALEEHRTMIQHLEIRIKEVMNNNGGIPNNDDTFNRIVLWKDYLQQDYKFQEDEVRYKVREAWMMMKILNLAKKIEATNFKAMFICDNSHFNGLEKLSEELGIEVEQIRIKRTIKTEDVKEIFEKDLEIEIS